MGFPLWGLKLREIPKITKDDFMKLLPIAALNAFGHTAAVIAMFEKGGGSFTHVIKASEPVVSTALHLWRGLRQHERKSQLRYHGEGVHHQSRQDGYVLQCWICPALHPKEESTQRLQESHRSRPCQ